MRSEIAEQPSRWTDLIRSQRADITAAAALLTSTQPELLVFVARGSSDHAAMYGQYLAHNLLQIPALLSTPSTVTAFGTALRYPRSVMIAVSQSGESPDLLDTVVSGKRGDLPIIALTNNDSSTLAGISDIHVMLSAGEEISVAATKTYTAELLGLYALFSLASGVSWEAIEDRLALAVKVATSIVADMGPEVSHLTETINGSDRVLVVGRGYSMSSAKEGALKLMETNALAASGWSAADATHGPLGQVIPGTPVILLTASRAGRESVETFGAAAEALGGRTITIGVPNAEFAGSALLANINWEAVDAGLIPLLEIIPIQFLALELALKRGKNPDQPTGLSKVTKTF
ncbi:SIS domain-containing protein [Arthrobacter sp. NA-172]|uniref:SIS domain-containing protein n=1 Tax=Arthrobacter sp. NA-172 TaxID=3367524 RepID=UPI003754E56E